MSTQYTFWELLDDYSIEIPMIQRDYAQGRKDRKSQQIRKEFVRSLHQAVSNSNITQDLDFIYGTDKNGKLILLDGQQRLTTLFLLHWYLAATSGLLEINRDKFAKFSYQTRASSRDFCNALTCNSIDELFNTETNISLLIEDTSWFYSVWKSDPTVQSMLTMLDEIHRVFIGHEDKSELWHKIIDRDNPAITFHFLNLDKFGLTDELYVKMNARGKALSDFENFKAWLLGYVEKHDEIDVPSNFWLSLDKEWTDIFWQYTSNPKFTNFEIDKPFMRFFNLVVLFEWCVDLNVPARKFDPLTEALIGLFQRGTHVSIDQYLKVNAFNNQFFDRINTFLEFIRNDANDEQLKVLFNAIKSPTNLTLTKLYPLYIFVAQNKEWEDVDSKVNELGHWIRITNNLTNNTIIDSPVDLVNVVQSLNSLANVEQDVYGKFANIKSKDISFFKGEQRQEEILKAKLVMENSIWETLFLGAESHEYFNGQIGFLLDMCLDEESNTYSQVKFSEYYEKASVLFSKKFHESNEFLLERALLASHNYLISNSSNKKFCKYLLTNTRVRDENWRNIFRESFFVEFLDGIHGNIEQHLRNLIGDASFNDWRQYFIDYPQTIAVCGEKEVRFDYGGDIYLLSKKRLSGKYAELRSYVLYCELIKRMKDRSLEGIVQKASYKSIHGELEQPSVSVKVSEIDYFISHTAYAYRVQVEDRDDQLVKVDESVLPNQLLSIMEEVKNLGESNE
jgi:hypothetical protein